MPSASSTRASLSLPGTLTTPRLVLRAWRTTDAPLLKRAIDDNLDHLRAWMPWARKEPSSLAAIQQRIERFDRAWRAGSEWSYAILSDGEKMLYGGCGVRRGVDKGVLEIGFWLQKSWTGQGYATEAIMALARAALGAPGIERVQIRCDERNLASAAVAQRAGFRHVTTVHNDVFEPGAQPRATMVWELAPTRDVVAPVAEPRASSGRVGVAAVAALVTSVVLLFAGHYLAFVGKSVDPRAPYWWSWLVMFPVAAGLFARFSAIPWYATPFVVCASLTYFVAIAVASGEWHANDRAPVAAAGVLLLAAAVARLSRPRRR